MKNNDLKNVNFMYKDQINIFDIPFGIEIEFANADFNVVKGKLEQLFGYEPTKIKWDSKNKYIIDRYKKWSLKNDATVQTHTKENIFLKFGGEITSPIMSNEKKCWQELKLVCDMLKQIDTVKINGNCSIHIHTDKHIFKNIQEYINLLKLWMVYEDVIYRFSYGEIDTPRMLITRYAQPIGYYIYERLAKLNRIETEKQLLQLLHYERKYGINLTNIDRNEKKTVEIRTYNGTLNEKIIQNDVLFNINFLNYSKEENFDKEFINYKVKKYKAIFLGESVKENTDKAIEFSKLIFKNELEQLYFLKQYFKEYSKDDVEKTYHL